MLINDAYKIACSELRKCYSDFGILAGKHQFDDYWARDGFFSSLGSNCLNDFGQSKKQFELFLNYMKEDGQLPMRIGSYNIILKLAGIKGKGKDIKPRYCEDKLGNITTDQNSIFIISFLDYIKKSNDYNFAKENFNKLEKIIKWNNSQDIDKDGIIEENYYAGWADSVKKKGKVFYTNILFYGALKSMSEICNVLKLEKDFSFYKSWTSNLGNNLDELFWNGSYYTDWINEKRYEYFSVPENELAIIFGLADKNKAIKIQENIEKFGINNDTPSKVAHPNYKLKHVSPLLILAGVVYYHSNITWLWIGCLDAIAKNKIGMKKEALEVLNKMADTIIKYGKVYEIYKIGMPYKGFFYKAEQPLAWNAGMFVYACNEVKWKN